MRQMMRAMGQKEIPEPNPTLEINPDHEIIKKLLANPDDARVSDAACFSSIRLSSSKAYHSKIHPHSSSASTACSINPSNPS